MSNTTSGFIYFLQQQSTPRTSTSNIPFQAFNMPRSLQFVPNSNSRVPASSESRSIINAHTVRQRHAKERQQRLQRYNQEQARRKLGAESISWTFDSFKDPFSALPKPLCELEYFLFHHYIHVVVPRTLQRCGLFHNLEDHERRILCDWVNVAIINQDLLSSVILLGACRHLLLSNPQNPTLTRMTFEYKQQGLRSLRFAVSGASPTVNSLSIAKAIALAVDEVEYGEFVNARQHIEGVFTMAESVGGVECLEITDLLKQMYYRFDELRKMAVNNSATYYTSTKSSADLSGLVPWHGVFTPVRRD